MMKVVARRWMVASAVLVLALIISGCGGGGGGGGSGATNSGANNLSGTAAAGSAIVGTVSVKDSLGMTRSAVIGATGIYQVDVTGMTPPFGLQAQGLVGDHSVTLYSAATAADIGNTINITPLTDLIIAMVGQQAAGAYFTAGHFSGITAPALLNAQDIVENKLLPVLTALNLNPSIDLLHASFSADHNGLDAMLDLLQESQAAPNSVMIEDMADGSSITCDVTNGNFSGTLTANNVSTYVTAMQQIAAQFNSLAQLFAAGLPSPTDPSLLMLFDKNNFIHDGENLSAFLSNKNLVGMQITAINVEQLGASQALVGYVLQAGGLVQHGEMELNWSGSNWLLAGNQHKVDLSLKSTSYLANAMSGGMMLGSPKINTGLKLDLTDPGNIGASYAIVTGTGLPTNTGGVSGTGAGVLLFKNTAGSFQVAAAGAPYSGTATKGLTSPADFYALSDTAISNMGDNSSYVVQVYDGGGSLLGSYTVTMAKPPYLASSLTASIFPVLTVPTNWMTMSENGGSASFSWTLPSGYKTDDLHMEQWGTAGEMMIIDPTVTSTDTATTMTIPAYSGTLSSSFVWFSTADLYDRQLAWGEQIQ
jgi:hypothetical protein